MITPIKDTMTKAQGIVTAFSASRLQLALLRTHQRSLYHGKTKGLIVACISRWGTYIGVINSLLNSKEVLQQYALNGRAALQSREQLLLDCGFWNELEDLKLILEPINTAQKKSKTDAAHLGYVNERWLSFWDDFIKLVETGRFPQILPMLDINGYWQEVFNQQTTNIHWVAYFLDPQNSGKPMQKLKITAFLWHHIKPVTDLK